jgi:hypothetical protein
MPQQQKMREADHLFAIEWVKAKRRELAGKKIEDPEVTLPQGRSPQTRDIVGDKIGMSGHPCQLRDLFLGVDYPFVRFLTNGTTESSPLTLLFLLRPGGDQIGS